MTTESEQTLENNLVAQLETLNQRNQSTGSEQAGGQGRGSKQFHHN